MEPSKPSINLNPTIPFPAKLEWLIKLFGMSIGNFVIAIVGISVGFLSYGSLTHQIIIGSMPTLPSPAPVVAAIPTVQQIVQQNIIASPYPVRTPVPSIEPEYFKSRGATPDYQILKRINQYHVVENLELLQVSTGKGVFTHPLPIQGDFIQDLAFDEATKKLVVTYGVGPGNGYDYTEMSQIYPGEDGKLQKKVLFTHPAGLYEATNIIHVSPDDTYILETGSGDGCGGSGRIWVWEKGTERKVVDYGVGCADVKAPRYLGYLEGKVYMNDTDGTIPKNVPAGWGDPSDVGTVSRVYTVGVDTGEKTDLIPAENIPKSAYYVTFAPNKNLLTFLLRGDSYITYDLQTKTFGQETKAMPGEAFR